MATGHGEKASQNVVLLETIQSKTDSAYMEDEEEEDAVGSFLQIFQHPPVEVTTRNKVICSSAFVVLILSMVGYVVLFAMYHVNFRDVVEHKHYFASVCAIYVLLGSDIFTSFIGIWTCVAKTGPRAMIFTCVWLLLSSLFHVCSVALLQIQSDVRLKKNNGTTTESTNGMKAFPETTTSSYNPASCKSSGANKEECDAADDLTVIIWCSLLIILLKLAVITLCRINYPQVFNWLLNKNVLLDQVIVEEAVRSLTHIGTLGAAYFAPCDIERLAARGSLYGTDVETASSSSKTILVQKTVTEEDDHQEMASHRKKSKRATFISSGVN